MEHIIRPDDITELCRFCDMDGDDLGKIIMDVENLDIKPQIGSVLLISIMEKPDEHTELLNGGTYEAQGKKFLFSGLKKAAAYYAYARAVRTSNNILTRTGLMAKMDDTSNHTDRKERQDICKSMRADADQYLGEVLKYLSEKNYPGYTGGRKVKQTRMKIHVIG